MVGGTGAGRALLGAILALALAACAEGSSAPIETLAAPSGPDLPVTVVDETGAEMTIESIERIIPLDGDVAEVVFALGLGDNVVATDLSATYPPEADALPEILSLIHISEPTRPY